MISVYTPMIEGTITSNKYRMISVIQFNNIMDDLIDYWLQ